MFRVLGVYNFECWKAKLEKPHFIKVHSGKITVCIALPVDAVWLWSFKVNISKSPPKYVHYCLSLVVDF